MSVKVVVNTTFYGGIATDKRLGPKASAAYTQALDFRKSPTQLSVLPKLTREDQGTVRDLVLKEVMTSSGTIYGYGDAGYFYKRSTAGVWSMEGKLTTGTGGMDYRQDANSIYLTSSKAASLYNQLDSTPQLFPDYYGPSYSTYNNTDNMGFNVNAYQAGSTQTTTLGTTIIENNTSRRFFQTDIEPLVKVSVFVVAKGTGNWTLTLHDGLNNVLGTKTIANASLVNNTWVDFFFTAAANQQVRAYVAPNARTYHVHVTSTVADGTISSSAINNMSTSDLQVWADRFVVTNNGLHPMIRFQQFEVMGNGNYLSVWEPITDVPTNIEWQRHRLKFPQEYEVCGLAVQNEFLVIAAGKTTVRNTSTPQEGILFFWDGTSNTYNYFIEIPEGTPYTLKSYKNIVYYVAGGAWYAVTSAQTQPVKIRTLPGSDNEFSGTPPDNSTSGIVGTVSFTSSTTWICPAGVYFATVEAWGGGGGGCGITGVGGVGGGGGGAYASSVVPVVPGTSYSVAIGAGGVGSTGTGTNGGNSTFNTSTVIAAGGTGSISTTGGAGGTTAASTGDTKFAGGAGGLGQGASIGAGGGGEAGGSTSAGNPGGDGLTSGPLSFRYGLGGSGASDGGDGGNGGAIDNGIPGTIPGGGGGGASRSSGAARTGGSGASGAVHITWGDVPLTATLVDNFTGTSSIPDATKWVSFGNYAQTNGTLNLTTNTAVSFNGVNSILHYDLTGSSMQTRLIDAGNQALTSLEVFPVLGQIDSSNQLYWYVNQNTIKAAKKVGGVNTFLASATYIANTFQYLRIREGSGTIYWDYSLDGVIWLNFASTVVSFSITRLVQVITIDNTSIEASTTTCIFDDYNVIVTSDYTASYPEMITVRRGVMMLGYPALTTNTTTNYGVYSWGSVDKNYPNSFGYSYLLSTGDQNFTSTNNLTIGMVKSFGDLMHVSWRDDLTTGTPRYGVDAVSNSSPPAPVAIYDTLVVTNNYTAKYKSGLFVESYYDLPVGSTITLSYKIDQGDWTDDPIGYTITNLWQDQPGYARFNIPDINGGRFRELQGRITVTSTSNVTRAPVVQEVNIAYDSNDKESIQ